MLYNKDPNMTYTDMAIYVDNEIRNPDPEVQTQCFEYLWHLFYINAVKKAMFQSYSEYEKFALFAATQLYVRYKKEQRPGNNLTPIKSCVNYIKKVLYPFRVDYGNREFRQVVPDTAAGKNQDNIRENRIREIRSSSDSLMRVEYEMYLRGICKTIKNYLKKSPYKNDPVVMHNLYLSCLFSLLNLLTMSRKNKKRLKTGEHSNEFNEDLVERIYEEEYLNSTVVYHLDKSMSNYISTTVNRIRKEIVKDLRYIIGSFEPADSVIKDILTSPDGNTRTYEGD